MLALCKITKRLLLLKRSGSFTPPLNLNASSKVSPPADLQSKATKRWNQADLSYFDLHLNRVHGKGKIIFVGKDIYYRNVVFFVQHLQSLITFKGAAFIKANVVMFFEGSALEWYISKLSNFDCNALNNNLGVKS